MFCQKLDPDFSMFLNIPKIWYYSILLYSIDWIIYRCHLVELHISHQLNQSTGDSEMGRHYSSFGFQQSSECVFYHPLQVLSSSGEQCHCILVDRWRRTHDHYITCARILHPLPTPLPEHLFFWVSLVLKHI